MSKVSYESEIIFHLASTYFDNSVRNHRIDSDRVDWIAAVGHGDTVYRHYDRVNSGYTIDIADLVNLVGHSCAGCHDFRRFVAAVVVDVADADATVVPDQTVYYRSRLCVA